MLTPDTPTPSVPRTVTAEQIVGYITTAAFRYRDETGLTHAIHMMLHHHYRIPADQIRNEVRLTAADRIDLMVGSIGIEVKIAGQKTAVWRQLARYAAHEDITELILVTTVARHVVDAPRQLHSKPVHLAVIRRGGLR